MRKQPEGFCLMKYRAEDGSCEEIIWNSRDGVTPFIVASRDGKPMQHVDWEGDRYAPHHIPKVGSRVFVDATMESCIEGRRAFAERHWNDPKYPMSERWESKAQAIGELAHTDLMAFAPHTPRLVEVTDEIAAFFTARAARREVDGDA